MWLKIVQIVFERVFEREKLVTVILGAAYDGSSKFGLDSCRLLVSLQRFVFSPRHLVCLQASAVHGRWFYLFMKASDFERTQDGFLLEHLEHKKLLRLKQQRQIPQDAINN